MDDDEDDEDKCYDSESFIGLYNNVNSDSPEGVASSNNQVKTVIFKQYQWYRNQIQFKLFSDQKKFEQTFISN